MALQPHYNLMERDLYEGELRDAVAALGIGVLPYFGLAKGFLTGKYRAGETVDSPRAERRLGVRGGEGGPRAGVRSSRSPRPTACRCRRWRCAGWPISRPSSSPIASAGTVEQLAELLPMQDLVLSDEERQRSSTTPAA